MVGETTEEWQRKVSLTLQRLAEAGWPMPQVRSWVATYQPPEVREAQLAAATGSRFVHHGSPNPAASLLRVAGAPSGR